jgi:hypothetical protein
MRNLGLYGYGSLASRGIRLCRCDADPATGFGDGNYSLISCLQIALGGGVGVGSCGRRPGLRKDQLRGCMDRPDRDGLDKRSLCPHERC